MDSGKLVVGYESALEFWRATRAASAAQGELDPEGRVYGAVRLSVQAQANLALELCAASAPLHAVVQSKNVHHRCKDVVDHVWSGPLTSEHLVPLERGIEVCKMPVVFVQLATMLSEVELAEIAYEMTGTYGFSSDNGSGFCSGLAPLLDVSDLKSYAKSAKLLRVRGAARACAALELVTEGSNSPRESEIAIFFRQTRAKGGIGLSGFSLNETIHLPKKLAAEMGQKVTIPDFSWSNGTLVEYDSDEYHNTPAGRARDEKKRRAYQAVGLDCLTLTNDILKSNEKLNRFVEDLERSLGIRRRPPSGRMLQKRADFRERIFGPESVEASLKALNNSSEG